MEYAADRWVQRLRDGVVPTPWPVIVGGTVLALGALATLAAELSTPTFFDHVTGARARSSALLFPAFLAVVGVVIVIGTRWSGRRDRLAIHDVRGMRVDYALWLDLTHGRTLVIGARTTLGRPFEAGQTKLDVLMRVLRSLRRDLGR